MHTNTVRKKQYRCTGEEEFISLTIDAHVASGEKMVCNHRTSSIENSGIWHKIFLSPKIRYFAPIRERYKTLSSSASNKAIPVLYSYMLKKFIHQIFFFLHNWRPNIFSCSHFFSSSSRSAHPRPTLFFVCSKLSKKWPYKVQRFSHYTSAPHLTQLGGVGGEHYLIARRQMVVSRYVSSFE